MTEDKVAHCFKTVILSSKVRIRKPDPAIYHLACRCIGSKESECAYVGDNPVRDVEGTRAASFGMVSGSLRSINSELEEMGEIQGASRKYIVRKITLPLVLPAVLSSAIMTNVNRL